MLVEVKILISENGCQIAVVYIVIVVFRNSTRVRAARGHSQAWAHCILCYVLVLCFGVLVDDILFYLVL